MIDENHGLVSSTGGTSYYVRVLSTIDREKLKPSTSIAMHRHSHSVVDILPSESDAAIQMMQVQEKPDVTFSDIGGYDSQKQEMREAVELPLTYPELYTQIGIDPPKGVLMYGPPGTGKTMMAKAVANSTTATFIRVVGSEFVQKYLGEGPRMVRDVFKLARENQPAIVFIDEVDSIATKYVIHLFLGGSMLRQVQIGKSKEFSSSSSIKWTASNRAPMSKLSCPQTGLILWIPLSSDQVDWIERWSSLSLIVDRNV